MAHVMRIASGGQCRTKCANGGVAPAILPPSGAAPDPQSGAALHPPLVLHRPPSLVLHYTPIWCSTGPLVWCSTGSPPSGAALEMTCAMA